MADGNIFITREIYRITRFNLSCISYDTRCKIPAFVSHFCSRICFTVDLF